MSLKKHSVGGYVLNSKTAKLLTFTLYQNPQYHLEMAGEIVNGKVYKEDGGKWLIKNN